MTTKIYRQVLSTKMYRQELTTKTCLQQREQEAASVSTTLKSVLNITALQRKNMCLGVVPGYSYILFNSLIKI